MVYDEKYFSIFIIAMRALTLLTPLTRLCQLGGNEGINLEVSSVLGQLGQQRHPRPPQGDVGEAQVPDLVLHLSLPVGVEDPDVAPGVLPARTAEVYQQSLSPWPAVVLSVGVLAAVAGAGGFITGFALTPLLTAALSSSLTPLTPPITAALQVFPAGKHSQQSEPGPSQENFPRLEIYPVPVSDLRIIDSSSSFITPKNDSVK